MYYRICVSGSAFDLHDFQHGRHDSGDDESVRQSHKPGGVSTPDRRTAGNRHLFHGLVLCL